MQSMIDNSHITSNELEVYKKILDACASNNSLDEVHIYEDLYDVDAQKAFEKLCESSFGIPGMRLDLLLDSTQTGIGGKDGQSIHKEEENTH